MTIRAVLFDLDHTLFDHDYAARAGLSSLLSHLDVPVTPEMAEHWFRIEDEQYQRYLAGTVDLIGQRRTRFRLFVDAVIGSAAHVTDDAADAGWQSYYDAYVESWRAFDESIDALQQLRSRGLKIGIITNGHHPQQVLKTERSGLAPLLDDVVSSGESGIAKPDPRIFELACQRLGIAPAEALFVGDNYDVDIAGALGAGLTALHIDRAGTVELSSPEGQITSIAQVIDWLDLFSPA